MIGDRVAHAGVDVGAGTHLERDTRVAHVSRKPAERRLAIVVDSMSSMMRTP